MRILTASLVVVLGLAGVAPAGAASSASPPAGVPTAAAAAVAAQQPIAQFPDVFTERSLGKPDAPLTLIEYSALTCPHCAHFHKEVLPRLKADYIDTGKLRQSTHADIKQDEATIEILKPAVDYAIYVHNGSPAVNGKLMAIEAAAISPRARAKLPPPNKKGMIFFTKRKAIPPNPFMERAVEKSRERVMSIFEDVAKRIANGMATK